MRGKDYSRETKYGEMTAQYNEVTGWTVYLDSVLIKSFGDSRMDAANFIDEIAKEE